MVLILGMDCVFCDVGTGLLSIIEMTIGVNVLIVTHTTVILCRAKYIRMLLFSNNLSLHEGFGKTELYTPANMKYLFRNDLFS